MGSHLGIFLKSQAWSFDGSVRVNQTSSNFSTPSKNEGLSFS